MKLKKTHVILTLLWPFELLVVHWASKNPVFIEQYYANGLYPIIAKALRIMFGWIPFSIGDLLIFALVFLLLRFVVLLIKNRFKNTIPKIISVVACASVVYTCFYLFWGLNYFREPLAKNLALPSANYTTEALITVTQHTIQKLNETQLSITNADTAIVISAYQPQEIYVKATRGFKNLAEKYPQLNYEQASVKSSLMSTLQTYNGTGGYLNPLTGEAQVNNKIPLTGYASTTCHEMAHQLGWAAENEANFIGYMAAIANDDIYFKYAGYRMATQYLILELKKRDQLAFQEAYALLNKGIIKDFKQSSAFWKSYQNPFEPIIKKGYNTYLKANNQVKGIASYNYVVDLIIALYQQELSL